MKRAYALVLRLVYKVTIPFSGLWLNGSKRVRVIVVHKQSILLQRSSFGFQKWSLPGGGVERGETLERAAARESEEETGVAVQEQWVSHIKTQARKANAGWATVNISFMLAKLPERATPKVVRPAEVLEVKWFSLADLPENRSDTVDAALALLKQM